MGLFFAGVVVANIVIFQVPAAVGVGVLVLKEKRDLFFWCTALLSAVIVLCARICLVLFPYLEAQKVPVWPSLFSLFLSSPLFWTYAGVLLLLLGALVMRILKQRTVLIPALLAGVLLSYPLQLVYSFLFFKSTVQALGFAWTY